VATQGGTLVETSTIPKTNFTITQGTLTIREYGNSVPYTLKAATLAEGDLPIEIQVALRNDMAKVLDSAAATQYTSADLKIAVLGTASTTFTTNSSAGGTAAGNLSTDNVKDIVDEMKKLNIPTFDGTNYVAICSTAAIRGLHDDFENITQYTDLDLSLSGEVGRYYMTRFVEETNFLSNSLGSGTQYGEAVFFGDDAVREAIALPEQLRMDSTDFGRDQGVAWLAMLGFQKIWDFSADGEGRIVHVTSS
jgi:N4-gp56 family major capsid protein